MNAVSRVSLATLLIAAAPLCGNAEDVAAECFAKEVETHVTQQFRIYGPQSANHEYFAFIYRHKGTIGSAVTRSGQCSRSGKCVVQSAAASMLIPRGAKVLGEWHTHFHTLRVPRTCPRKMSAGAQQPSHPLLFRVLQQAHRRDLRLGPTPDFRTYCDRLRVPLGNYVEQVADGRQYRKSYIVRICVPGYERSGTFALAPHFLKQCALLGAVLSRLFRERLEMRMCFQVLERRVDFGQIPPAGKLVQFQPSRPSSLSGEAASTCSLRLSPAASLHHLFRRWPASPPARSLLWGEQAVIPPEAHARQRHPRKQSRHQVRSGSSTMCVVPSRYGVLRV